MNPDSGKLHNVDEAFKQLFGRVNRKLEESAEQMLERAKKRHEELADGEPAPGSPLPPSWPKLEVGQELKQVRGWKMVIESVDVEKQVIVVKPVRR
jgi:hypothetical protein